MIGNVSNSSVQFNSKYESLHTEATSRSSDDLHCIIVPLSSSISSDLLSYLATFIGNFVLFGEQLSSNVLLIDSRASEELGKHWKTKVNNKRSSEFFAISQFRNSLVTGVVTGYCSKCLQL